MAAGSTKEESVC